MRPPRRPLLIRGLLAAPEVGGSACDSLVLILGGSTDTWLERVGVTGSSVGIVLEVVVASVLTRKLGPGRYRGVSGEGWGKRT